jgi:hypothetical protein
MAHPDIDSLLNLLLNLAKQMLERAGEFHPFSAALAPGGMPMAMPMHDGAHHASVEALIDQLVLELRVKASAGEITTAGVCLDAWVVLPGTEQRCDAIEVRLEHGTGQAVRVFLPYIKGGEGELSFGEIFATHWEPGIFVGRAAGDA